MHPTQERIANVPPTHWDCYKKETMCDLFRNTSSGKLRRKEKKITAIWEAMS